MSRIRLFLPLTSLLILLALTTARAAERVTVFIRVDDLFSRTSPVRPVDMDEFLGVAERHGAHVSLAAIPNRLLQPVNENGAMTRKLIEYADRGHQIIQHGYDHQCPFSGNTGREFSTTQSLTLMTQEQRIEKILEGRRLLEAAIGRPVTSYCGPGADDGDLLPIDAPLLRRAGFQWLKDAPGDVPILHETGGGSYPVMLDFAWGLTQENYQERLRMEQEYCLKSFAEGRTCNVKFHDPFTRSGYENGAVIRWFDEVLNWLESQPDWEIHYATLDEYLAEHNKRDTQGQ